MSTPHPDCDQSCDQTHDRDQSQRHVEDFLTASTSCHLHSPHSFAGDDGSLSEELMETERVGGNGDRQRWTDDSTGFCLIPSPNLLSSVHINNPTHGWF